MANEPTKHSLGSRLPSVQYPSVMNVLQSISEGMTETKACEIWGVSVAAFRYRMKNDEELQELYADATRLGNDALADTLINIDQVHSSPAMASVISKNTQWLLERRNPDKYGARVTVTSENRASMALIAALDKAMDRIPMASAPIIEAAARIVDVEYVPVSPLPPPDAKEPAPFQAPASSASKSSTTDDAQQALLRQMGLLD